MTGEKIYTCTYLSMYLSVYHKYRFCNALETLSLTSNIFIPKATVVEIFSVGLIACYYTLKKVCSYSFPVCYSHQIKTQNMMSSKAKVYVHMIIIFVNYLKRDWCETVA